MTTMPDNPIPAAATRLTMGASKTDPALLAALERARHNVMTPAERDAQRRSWVRGEMMLEHPEMTADEANALMDKASDPRPLPAAAVELDQAASKAASAVFWAGDLVLPYVDGGIQKRLFDAIRAYVSALPHLAAPADVAGLVARFRSGEPCHPPCKAMDARSGCICAEAVDGLTAVAVERDALAERLAASQRMTQSMQRVVDRLEGEIATLEASATETGDAP